MCAYCTEAQALYLAGVANTDVTGGSTAITQFISWADALIDQKTGKTWTASSAKTDHFDLTENVYEQDWLRESGLAHYDAPYEESRHYVKLTYSPVTGINRVMLLRDSESFSYAYTYNGSTYTDVESYINDVRGTPVELDGDTENNAIYFACSVPFNGIGIEFETVGVTGVIGWYYLDSDGTAHSLTVTASVTGVNNFTASGNVTWTIPSDWSEYDLSGTITGSGTAYWIKALVTSTVFTTNPKFSHVYTIDPVNEFVSPGLVAWASSGEFLLRNDWVDGGVKNLRVDYLAGAGSTPTIVSELSANLTAQHLLANMMGASFDSTTSASLPELSYTEGEPYMSQMRTLEKLKEREQELWKLVGCKPTLVVM